MPDIAEQIGKAGVAAVVERFYRQVRQHPRLAIPFARVEDWPAHLEHLSHFWWVTLGGERYLDYRYQVAQRHAQSGFTPALLADWLALFRQTLFDSLPPELANAWLARAERIGQSLLLMHEHGHIPSQASLGGASIVARP
ncbi:group III truncated hemoglobin [Chitinimonas sp.]|uniref:group III truncated hemoglobin n=1 Tax=Chitinimonas sp. TaxID=1934313 RepID=UPI0035B2C861